MYNINVVSRLSKCFLINPFFSFEVKSVKDNVVVARVSFDVRAYEDFSILQTLSGKMVTIVTLPNLSCFFFFKLRYCARNTSLPDCFFSIYKDTCFLVTNISFFP